MGDVEKITEDYLLNHGFIKYSTIAEGDIYNIPFFGKDDIHYREKRHDRQMFVVVFMAVNGNVSEGYNAHVFVQQDAGCGFVEMPFPWWDLLVEYFESVYYGIRGYYPINS